MLRKFPGCPFSEGGQALLGEAGVRADPLQAEASVWGRAGHPGPSSPSWVPATSGGDLHGPPTCMSSSSHLFPEAGGLGVLGSTEDFLAPKEIPGVSPPQAAASCLAFPLLPTFLGFCAMGFASNGLGLESKTPHKTCILVRQCLEAKGHSDPGICRLFGFSARVRCLPAARNCQEPQSSWRTVELPRSAQGLCVT